MSLKYERAFINSVFEDFSIIFAFFADVFYFHYSFSVYQVIGSVLLFLVAFGLSYV